MVDNIDFYVQEQINDIRDQLLSDGKIQFWLPFICLIIFSQ